MRCPMKRTAVMMVDFLTLVFDDARCRWRNGREGVGYDQPLLLVGIGQCTHHSSKPRACYPELIILKDQISTSILLWYSNIHILSEAK